MNERRFAQPSFHPSSFRLHPWIRAGVAQLVEHQPSKLRVASSNLVARSSLFVNGFWHSCPRSSGVERLLGKEEVMSSNLIAGSIHSAVRVRSNDSFHRG